MKTYEVVIQATVTKAIIVNAKDKDAAKEEAYEHFNITHEIDPLENYREEMLSIEELEYDKEYDW